MAGRTFIRFLNSFLHTGTPSSETFLRGDGEWASAFSGGVPYGEFIVPSTITVNAGGTPVGTVTDVQSLLDGNVYQIPEVAATPGFDIDFNFTNVASIGGFVSNIWYDGSATHNVALDLFNYTDVQQDSFLHVSHSASLYSYRTVLMPDDTKYINGSNEAQLSLYHYSGGNASHDIYIDYIALIGTTV